MSRFTSLLNAAACGDRQAAAALLPVVYDELRKLAAARIATEPAGQTLQGTDLVHEAFLRLVGDQQFNGRGHFFAAAAEAMRRILVEAARRKHGPRRGGGFRRLAAELDDLAAIPDDPRLLDLNEAIDLLAAESPIRAELVKLRFFAGLTTAEAAEALGLSIPTAERYWAFSRAWLFARLRSPDEDPENP